MSARRLVAGTLFAVLLAAAAPNAYANYTPDDAAYCRGNWFGPGKCWRRPHNRRRPVLTWGVELGVGHLNESQPFGFGNSTGAVTNAGPAWGLRVGVDFLSWLGVELRYFGGYYDGHGAVVIAGDVNYVLTAGEFIVRLTLPVPWVRPYIFSGIGIYNFQLNGSDVARAASTLNSSTQPGAPIGVGLEVPLTWHVSVAVEGVYHFQFGESFSKVDAISGADLSTLTAVLRFRL